MVFEIQLFHEESSCSSQHAAKQLSAQICLAQVRSILLGATDKFLLR